MKSAAQIVILVVGLILVFLFAVPFSGFVSGTSAIQATQLYAGAQIWLQVLLVLGLIFAVGLLGSVAGTLDELNRTIKMMGERMLTRDKEGSANEKADG